MKAIFDEVKGVYRVNKADGSFETYTPDQYRALNGAEVVVEEEEGDEDIVIEDEVDDVVIEASEDETSVQDETQVEDEKTEGGMISAVKNVFNN